jgi:hypothetical protein
VLFTREFHPLPARLPLSGHWKNSLMSSLFAAKPRLASPLRLRGRIKDAAVPFVECLLCGSRGTSFTTRQIVKQGLRYDPNEFPRGSIRDEQITPNDKVPPFNVR